MSNQNEMQEYQIKAFDFTNDLIKQIMTISVAVITLAAGSLEHLAKFKQPFWLGLTFFFYAASIVGGLIALMNLTGSLDLDNENKVLKERHDITNQKLEREGKTPVSLIPCC